MKRATPAVEASIQAQTASAHERGPCCRRHLRSELRVALSNLCIIYVPCGPAMWKPCGGTFPLSSFCCVCRATGNHACPHRVAVVLVAPGLGATNATGRARAPPPASRTKAPPALTTLCRAPGIRWAGVRTRMSVEWFSLQGASISRVRVIAHARLCANRPRSPSFARASPLALARPEQIFTSCSVRRALLNATGPSRASLSLR